MAMTKDRQQALQQALLSAFATAAELEQMLYFGMDVRLAQIATGNLSEQVFAVIKYADTRGQLERLLQAAVKANPDNPELRAFVAMPAELSAPVQPVGATQASVDKRALRTAMLDSFSLEELDILCGDLGEQYLSPPLGQGALSLEDLAGTTKQAKIVSMIQYFEHRGLLDVLVSAVRTQRPGRL